MILGCRERCVERASVPAVAVHGACICACGANKTPADDGVRLQMVPSSLAYLGPTAASPAEAQKGLASSRALQLPTA